MMFVDNNFFNNESTARLGCGLAVAVCLHLIFFAGLSIFHTQNTITADLMSLPTNVSIRFVSPQKQPAKIVKPAPKITKITPKKTAQKITTVIPQKTQPDVLNRIEPAAAAQQVQQPIAQAVVQTRPVQKSIPVVSDKSLKGRRVQPKYPDRALRMKQEGVVWVRVLISETGSRKDIKLHKPSKYALLNQAAIKAVKKWTFSPNVVSGQATQSWVEIPVEFKIQ